MFNVLFKNHVKLVVQQSLYWGSALFVITFAFVLYNLYFVDQTTTFWEGETSPPARYMVIYLGGIPLVLMMLVSCFLSIRTLAKDSHSRIEEVLLTKPFGNLVHALSATLASTLLCALPIIGFIFGVYLVTLTQGWFNAVVAEPFEFVSVSVFLCFTTIISLNFVSLLCYYVYATFKVAILGLLASAAIVILAIYLFTRVSFNQFVFFEFIPLVGDVASDMIGNKLNFLDYTRFILFLCLGATLTVGATWLKSRRDEQERFRSILLGYFGAITCISFSILLASWFNHSSNESNWKRHLIHGTDGITLDLQRISGRVDLRPGKAMEAEIIIIGTSTDNIAPRDELVFWLNPGFKVNWVQDDGGDLPFARDGSSLRVTLRRGIDPGESVEITIQYRGKPNTLYGYQDSALDVETVPFWDQLISYYGMRASVFDRKYVALPHATHWLPTSTMQSTLGAGSIDFKEASLSITIPKNWVTTLTGNVTTQELSSNDERIHTIRFTSRSPMAGISLYASDMNKYATYLDPIDLSLELYASDRHLRSFQTKEDHEKYLPVFKSWLIDKIEEARALGYSFPCDSFRLIAVPSNLRLYGGGSLMNSTMTEPCTYLIREHGAIASNPRPIPKFRGEDFDYTPMYRNQLEGYFDSRHNGENLALSLPNHYFEFQTGIVGSEGLFLKKILSYLHNHTWSRVPPNPTPYSPSVFFPRAMQVKRISPKAEFLADFHGMVLQMDEATLQMVLGNELSMRKSLTTYVKRYTRHIDQTGVVFRRFLESDAVVNIAVHNSLQTLTNLEPNALRQEAIRLRCIALAEKIYTILGRADSRLLLQEISNIYQYQNINVSDVFVIADSLDLPVREIMAGWFDETEQFHFSFSPATYSQHINPDTQKTYYQIRFAVANSGSTTGVFHSSLRVAPPATESGFSMSSGEDRELWLTNLNNSVYDRGPRLLIPAGTSREVGIVTSRVPYRVNLSSSDVSFVNEVSLLVQLESPVGDLAEQDPLEGTWPSTWAPEPIHGVVIDDVDLPVQHVDDGIISYDKNLEIFDFGGAWGTSRKSFVYTENLKKAKVFLESELPARDKWQIEFHVPDIRGAQNIGHRKRRMMVSGRTYFRGKFEGRYEIEISNGDQRETFETEVYKSDYGWHTIGSAELTAGSVDVTIKPKLGTEQLFFDAMRFVRASEE